MRITGLEPARHGHQNLNLARLPIPPYPPLQCQYIITDWDFSVKFILLSIFVFAFPYIPAGWQTVDTSTAARNMHSKISSTIITIAQPS